jgi:hypothetical protein
MRRYLIIALILLTLVSPVQAGVIYDEVSSSISAGIETFIRGLVDDIVSISVSSTNSTQMNQNVGVDLIYSVATFTPNPFSYGPIFELKRISEDVYFEALGFMMMLTAISAALHYVSVPAAAKLNEALGLNLGAGINKLLFACAAGIFIFAFEMCFLWVVLSVNDELSKAVILPSLNAIAFNPENLLLYVFLGLAYGVLMLCFYFRTLIILFWAGFGVLIGLLLIPKKTQDWALNAHYYLIQIVFYQFAIVAWYSFCIILIQGVPFEMQKVMYLIMVLVSVYFSYKFIFGINIIKSAGKAAKYVTTL